VSALASIIIVGLNPIAEIGLRCSVEGVAWGRQNGGQIYAQSQVTVSFVLTDSSSYTAVAE
jgi:hypothetical protein